MKNAILLAMVAGTLAACGDNSASVGAGSGADTGSKSDSAISKIKSVFGGEELKANIKMPAQALIAEGIMHGRDSRMMGLGSRQLGMNGGSAMFSGMDMEKILAESIVEEYKKDPATWLKENENVNADLIRVLKNGASVDAVIEINRRQKYDGHLAACIGSQFGWEVSPMSDRKKAEEYMRYIASSCDFTNVVFTEIAGKLGAKTMKDPDEAKAKIRETWEKWPEQTLKAMWEKAQENNKEARYTPDLTGVKGVKFIGPGGQYWNEGAGYTVKNNGVTWFGDGYLSGKAVEFSLASSVGTKLEKSKQLGSGQESGVSSRTGADIGVK